MSTEPQLPRSDVVVATTRAVIPSGVELVALSSRFYVRIFTAALLLVAAVSATSLLLLPLRQSSRDTDFGYIAIVTAATTLTCALAALPRAAQLYGFLRSEPRVEIPIVVAAAGVIALVPPLQSELWTISCGLLCVLAVVAPLGRVLAYCVLVLVANLTAHLVVDDLDRTPAVAIVGLWIGVPFWAATVGVTTERMARYVMHIGALRSRHGGLRQPPADRTVGVPLPPDPVPTQPEVGSEGDAGLRLRRLTARQLEVVALLIDGYTQSEIAALLGISIGGVQRHVAAARRKTGAQNTNELIALAVDAGLAPRPNL